MRKNGLKKSTWIIAIGIVVFVIIVVIASCAPALNYGASPLTPNNGAVRTESIGGDWFRFSDPEYNVTCWKYYNSISCLPNSSFERVVIK
jgi:hypothetical protein